MGKLDAKVTLQNPKKSPAPWCFSRPTTAATSLGRNCSSMEVSLKCERIDMVKKRCEWVGESNLMMLEYHDREWGVPVHDDPKTFRVSCSGRGTSRTELVDRPEQA
jgi:hypothetical protein